ncbi:2-hydroxyacid dehydrogenase [Microbacterium sp. SLBN-146]|uniref:2-hydroxyacid dehydrogenase n=1 Tax=Microbacterium sp. SLBN-146 TaxID=2768457 RepID=UPI00114EE802|nr:2-hydroxyacid dehydrogenase [Microbacterium sp. SLBN-146]
MTHLVVSVPSEELAADLQPLPDGVDLVVWPMDSPSPRERFDLVVPPYMSMSRVLERLKGVDVGLVQGQSIGYEGVAELLPPGLPFANAASVHEASTAELALALVLASQRQLPSFVRSQDARAWHPVAADSLADRNVLVLGFGGVGKAVAARLAPFETHVTAVATRARIEGGVEVHTLDDLPTLLPTAEIVILTLPGGDATQHLVDAEFLAALPDAALVVNVGRGTLVDTDALVSELQAGRLRAALDVTEPEPLPGDHPLWSAPGTLIAPHVGGASSAMRPRIAKLVRTQIERMLAGQEPLNVVIDGEE